MTRFEVKNTAAAGGFHVQISDRDPELIQIMFFERNGILATDETRKDVEKYFNRQEVRRALMNQLGELSFPPRVTESYVEELLRTRRRADPREALPDRGRLRVLERGAGDAGTAAPAAGRVVLDALVHGPRRGGDPAGRPAGLHLQTRRLVEAMGADLGVVLDRAAERIMLIDEQAREIPADTTLHLMLGLVASTTPAGPDRAAGERVARRRAIAAAYGVEVVRAGITQAGLIEAAAADGVVFAGSPDGGFIFPAFSPASTPS